jgi:hypothetical protein
MERRAKVRGLLASVSTTSDGKKRMEFVKRGFNAAINLRRCAVLENKPPEWTRRNLVGQSLKGELYERKLESVVGSQSKKTGGASARQLETICLRRVRRHCCVLPASFDFERRS